MIAANIAEGLINDPDANKVAIVQILWLCASQFYDVADIAVAKKYAEKAIEIFDDQGVEVPLQMKVEALQALGVCHLSFGEYRKALPCLQRAHDLVKDFDPHNAAGIANNLATTYQQLEEFDEALAWLQRAKDYEVGPQREIRYQYTEGSILAAQGKTDQARKMLLAALKAEQQESYGTDKTSSTLHLLGKLDYQDGNYESAQNWLEKSRQSQTTYLQELLTKASEPAAISYLHYDWRQITDLYLQVTKELTSPEQIRRQYELISQQRGLVIRALALRNRVRRNLSGAGSQLFQQYLALSHQLLQLKDGGQQPKIGSKRNQLQTRIEVLEAKLAKFAPELVDEMQSLFVPLDDLQAALADGELAIDFVQYATDGPDAYAIFVVTPDAVYRTDLPDAGLLHQEIHQWRSDIASGHGDRLAKSIYQRVWNPIERYIDSAKGTDTIYVCGDGALLLMPWNALQRDDGSILLEHYAIANPPYPQHLLVRSDQRLDEQAKLLAIGDVAFGHGDHSAADKLELWRELPHTRTELAALKQHAAKANVSVAELVGARATATNVAELLPESSWIHVATHGFQSAELKSSTSKLTPIVSDRRHPLVSKELILAGANDGDLEGQLNGAAISNLDLQGVELVFLSACDTAVGDVFDGEGVYGLQRAFHAAGAQNVICSLWQIDDAATTLLVQKFYDHYWEGGLSPLHALRQAQLELYRNPLLLEQFKQQHRVMFAQARGRKFRPLKAAKPKAATLPPALWAGFIYSGTAPK